MNEVFKQSMKDQKLTNGKKQIVANGQYRHRCGIAR